MKGSGGYGWSGGGASSTKRRWRWLVIGVLCLVFLSMLVPLVFLLGFHSAGYASEQHNSESSNHIGIKYIGRHDASISREEFEGRDSRDVEEIITRLVPPISKDVIKYFVDEMKNKTIGGSVGQSNQHTKGSSITSDSFKPVSNIKDTTIDGAVETTQSMKVAAVETTQSMKVAAVETTQSMKVAAEESEKSSCELKYGSYCLWRQEHKEEMHDFMVKKLKDQLFVARAYYPSIAKLPAHDKLSRELKLNIQDLERILSESTTDADLPSQIEMKSQKMESIIVRSKLLTVDCNNVDKKLRQLVDLTEDEANFHMKQSAFLYQVAVQTLPKSHHCLFMRLTVEYFASPSLDTDLLLIDKYTNPAMQHYIILSNNVLAASVVINSTVMNSNVSGNLVFHVLTDGRNYFAMKQWFIRNANKEATVQVLNIEDLNLDYLDKATLHPSEEFRISYRNVDNASSTRIRTDYLSIFSHSHFLLPEIFPNLDKVVVLDDDVIVQQDLSALWSLNVDGKVIGAVPHCKVRLGQLKNYFGEERFDYNSCTWMSGLTVVDLVRWREQNLTGICQKLLNENWINGEKSSAAAALRATLHTFQNEVFPLDNKWALSGLGHDYGLNIKLLKNAAVLHYNGKMKPWLDMGIPKYKNYWRKFMNRDDQFLSDCNINP